MSNETIEELQAENEKQRELIKNLQIVIRSNDLDIKMLKIKVTNLQMLIKLAQDRGFIK